MTSATPDYIGAWQGMKRHLTLAALTAALALPLTATGQTCEDMKAGKAFLKKAADSFMAEGEEKIKDLKINHAMAEAGAIDPSQARRKIEEIKVWRESRKPQEKGIPALMDALHYTAEAKGCQL